MITDEQMITAILTARQYCKEHRDCNKCVFNKICTHCDYEEYIEPMFWELPGDDEIIADIGELNDDERK